MKRLELKLLPPVVTLLAAGGMALTAQYLPTLKFVVPEKTALCVLLFLGGLLCELSGFLAFWKVRTSINPLRPAQASWMVRHGIPTVTLGAGQNLPHTVEEWIDLDEFDGACRLALTLATRS